MKLSYKHTLFASYTGYITQAIVANLAPLLFLTFQRSFGITLGQIGFLVTLNFLVQTLVDFLAAKFIDRIGYRIPVVMAHVTAVIGLVGLSAFPFFFPSAYAGLITATVFYAIGGGLIEVLVSPIVEALPNDQKASAMSLLHSFYCWGQVSVVLFSTLFFVTVGIDRWYILPLLWAIIPLINAFVFAKVPINIYGEGGEHFSFKRLFGMKFFWLFIILMICSGASELAISQWSSLFAESGLKVSKTIGDLLGPCLFAVLMGVSRVFYGKFGEKINLANFIELCGLLCVGGYLLTVLSPFPILSLIGCGICGLAVGIMWPGTLSLSARYCPQGGTAMFALLALAGDIGCSSGPSVVGLISERFADTELGLKIGIGCAAVFPVLMLVCIGILKRRLKAHAEN